MQPDLTLKLALLWTDGWMGHLQTFFSKLILNMYLDFHYLQRMCLECGAETLSVFLHAHTVLGVRAAHEYPDYNCI